MPRGDKDDLDDFMAGLFGSAAEKTTGHPTSAPAEQQHGTSKPAPQTAAARIQPLANVKHKRKSSKKIKLAITIPIATVILMAIGFVLWNGPVRSLLTPSSPFTQTQQEQMGFPLYYPTKLPGSYKIETDSISQPETDVIMYVISDDEGSRINMTLQKHPEGLNLEPLYSVLKDTKDIDTSYGSVKIGVSEDGIAIANILTPETWIIISSKDSLDEDTVGTIINNLKS